MAVVRAALAADGPLTRSQLRERVAAAGVRTEGQAMVHILALASIRGLIVRGPPAGRDQAFVLARDWLGAQPPAMSREAALGELARRYLAGHAPAADRDLARWAGTGLRDARLGLARCGAVQRADGLAGLPANPQRAAAALPPPLLLGAFEPLLPGWSSRDPVVGPNRRIVTVNGLFRPFALAGGRAVATWTIAGGQVVLAPFALLDAGTRAACVVAKAVRSPAEVIGVQSGAAPAAYRSWQAGTLAEDTTSTFAEGLATRTAFELPQRILRNLLAGWHLL